MTATKWILDPTHSEVQFKVKHLMISNVTGQFNEFEGNVETDGDDFSSAKVSFTANIHSISTNNDQRDEHLRNSDFFDAENHPSLVFHGQKLVKTDGDEYKLHGTLQIKGITKEVVLDAEYGGIIDDPWGNKRAGFTVSGKINRRDFGVVMPTETGGLLLGEEIRINANAQFVKQGVLEPA